MVFNCKILKPPILRERMRQACLLSPLLFNIVLKVLASKKILQEVKKGEERKVKKKEIKL